MDSLLFINLNNTYMYGSIQMYLVTTITGTGDAAATAILSCMVTAGTGTYWGRGADMTRFFWRRDYVQLYGLHMNCWFHLFYFY